MRLFIGTTFFSSLIFKKAPGTVSSFAVFIFLFFFDSTELWWKLSALLFFVTSHYFCFPFFQKKYLVDDPPLYTLDEAVAMIFLNIFFSDRAQWLAAFFLFRLFDILKPLGIKQLESVERLPLSLRNIIDDLVAAVYTAMLIFGYDYFFQ